MKVGFVIDSLAGGGAERMLLRQLTHSPLDPTVYHLGGPEDLKEEFEAVSGNLVNIGPISTGYLHTVDALRRHLASDTPDILHAHLPDAHVVSRPAGLLAGVPHTISTHHNVASSPTYQSRAGLVERLSRPLDSVQIAVSRAVVDSHQRTIAGGEWKVIPNAIDLNEFGRSLNDADAQLFEGFDPVFLNVGRYTEQKGQETLLKAMPIVLTEFPNALAVLVGWGRRQSDLEDFAEELGVSDHVVLTGHVPEIHDYYASSDIFAFPSKWEGFGIVLLEAMAAEMPIVASDIQPINDIVAGDHAVLTDPSDPDDLADAMVQQAKADIGQLGKKGLYKVRDKYSVEALVESHQELYRSLQ